MRRRPNLFVYLAFSGFSILLAPAIARAQTVATAGDASISQDESSGTWMLSAAGTRLTLSLGANRDFALERLVTGSGASWTRAIASDSIVKVEGRTVSLGSRREGFTLQGVSVDTQDQRLQLNATFELPSASLRVTRHYAIASGSPTFEAWNTYAPNGGAPELSDLNAVQLVITPGVVHSLSGLMGDNADAVADGEFTLSQRSVNSTQPFSIGATGRSSESSVPWIAVDGGNANEFYLSLMWSGAWSMTATPSGAGLSIVAGLAPMTTRLAATVDGPHVVFGAVVGGQPEAAAALASYIVNGVRAGRALTPLVTYNTWFAYGTEVDEASMMAEMDSAAALGAELFVIDAGWYVGAGAGGPVDFDAGLGSWTPDPARFPNGLRPLRDHAHDLGIKFGLWVEPERVSLSLVGGSGIGEQWLVTSGGQYGSDHAAQICLSNSGARNWILGWLTPLLDQVRPDYLKWDNNMWVNCNREGHAHGAADGNFAQVNGLYEVLATLRKQYPDLLIENVSGGGNRLDLGMMRYTDVAWMDDRTAPSIHVRHNLEGLSAVFPPAYLLSFVTDNGTEPLHAPPDVSLYFRSRMAGVLGLCFRSDEYTEGEAATMAHEIAIYKAVRDTLNGGSASLLTVQAEPENGPAWDVEQVTDPGTGQALICAYQTDDGTDSVNVKPLGLDSSTTYQVVSVDSGVLGTATGSDLMTSGIDVLQSPNTAAHILTLSVKN
jgi:alpha-galactosidase